MAQTLAWHSGVRLTLGLYTHVALPAQAVTIGALPGPPWVKKDHGTADGQQMRGDRKWRDPAHAGAVHARGTARPTGGDRGVCGAAGRRQPTTYCHFKREVGRVSQAAVIHLP